MQSCVSVKYPVVKGQTVHETRVVQLVGFSDPVALAPRLFSTVEPLALAAVLQPVEAWGRGAGAPRLSLSPLSINLL